MLTLRLLLTFIAQQMAILGISLLAGVVLATVVHCLKQWLRLWQTMKAIPGPRCYPILGNALQHIKKDQAFVFEAVSGCAALFNQEDRVMKLWFGPYPAVVVYGADSIEEVMTSTKCLTKDKVFYASLIPWLNSGLLTSKPKKWRPRRKLLTPTFHYEILKDFVPIFNEHAQVLIEILRSECSNKETSLSSFITRCTLDIICESAMGRNVGAQKDFNCDYVKSITRIAKLAIERSTKPWLHSDWLFRLFGDGVEFYNGLNVVHTFSNKVIAERAHYLKQCASGKIYQNGTDRKSTMGQGKRRAFLDLLLEMKENGEIDDDGIREEVDTFMFEGHDTTASALEWFLLLIGHHPAVQHQLQLELESVFGDDRDRPVTNEDLKKLTYMECSLKESLRLYPSVPIIARNVDEPMQIGKYQVPANVGIIVFNYMAHRDTKHWPDPEVFDPSRFYPENCAGRHPFAYTPFAAGYRNCIGQRFAMMEEKTLAACVLRSFTIKSISRRDQVLPKSSLVLHPANEILIKLIPRK